VTVNSESMKKTVNRIEDMDVFKKAHKIAVRIYGILKSLTDTDTGH
jgi:hypothetical protein